ncbi:DUF2716 domain-containing protein [Streptomyces sp. BE133]|uniref:DUF2716 domain-containing protein n=1 Tax=Streptomyces sp. BE133 TaxID=3002523 RepID=UPI002E76B327|nr:DUF2716 domain-containing protein [Streptomyces sp. BE133]MEE1806266.1 DUF2716 domain-containing protein [Streptomyces sp. BE133]
MIGRTVSRVTGRLVPGPNPNGNYFIFLSEDFRAGSFGHPWEESPCLFGSSCWTSFHPVLGKWHCERRR